MSQNPVPTTQGQDGAMDLQQIMEVLPHRHPFLLLDRILCRDGLQSARGVKNLTANEEFFQGHFPGRPEMPRTLLVECMAQAGAAAVLAAEANRGKNALFASIDRCRFGRAAVPGDVLEIDVETLSMRRDMGKMRAICRVGQEEIARGELMFALVDSPAEDLK
ncbi:MAG: 3-hydroxyacyl-ACP dehydratase FabZ [Candidatus Xenobium sp.]